MTKKVARADLNKRSYKNETYITFEKCITKLKGIFNVLEKYDVPIYEEYMVEHLLYQTTPLNTELNTEVNICSFSQLSTLVKASMYLFTVVVRL